MANGTVNVSSEAINESNPMYGVCETAASTAAKTVSINGFQLETGVSIHVKFKNSNSASNPTLSVNGGPAYYIRQYGTTSAGTSSATTGWYAGSVVDLTFDGSGWIFNKGFNYYSDTNSDTIPQAYSTTSAGTAAKTASCTNYVLTPNTYLMLNLVYANSYNGALTLNVNSRGAKPLYINGVASSSTNRTLPAGSYMVYFDGTNYYLRTDGVLPGKIERANAMAVVSKGSTTKGIYIDANGVPQEMTYQVNKTVPSNAVFTDTTYSAATQSADGLMSAADKKKLDGVATGANNYTHPTTTGNKHIPSGGIAGQILRWSADGTAEWGADNNTTYSAATQSSDGLMSAADKKKLDGVATKVTAITASSTDDQYPSAKAVYDLFSSIANGNEVSY